MALHFRRLWDPELRRVRRFGTNELEKGDWVKVGDRGGHQGKGHMRCRACGRTSEEVCGVDSIPSKPTFWRRFRCCHRPAQTGAPLKLPTSEHQLAADGQ